MPDSPERALVLAHWNSWVRVWLPDRGETRWIDLEEAGGWEPLEPAPRQVADPPARCVKSVD